MTNATANVAAEMTNFLNTRPPGHRMLILSGTGRAVTMPRGRTWSRISLSDCRTASWGSSRREHADACCHANRTLLCPACHWGRTLKSLNRREHGERRELHFHRGENAVLCVLSGPWERRVVTA